MTIYSNIKDNGMGIFRPMKEADEIIDQVINYYLDKQREKGFLGSDLKESLEKGISGLE